MEATLAPERLKPPRQPRKAPQTARGFNRNISVPEYALACMTIRFLAPGMQISPCMRFALLALTLAASGGAAHAQEGEAAVQARPRRARPVELMAGARVGLAAAGGGLPGHGPGAKALRERVRRHVPGRGAGLGAGAVRVGWTTTGGIGMTARAQISVLRTWRDPWLVGPHQTWIGADAQAGFGYVGVAVGAYVRAPVDGASPAPMLTLNLVLGN